MDKHIQSKEPLHTQVKVFNMKKLIEIFIFSFLIFIILVSNTSAASVSPTPVDTQTQIDELQTKIASRVAQLNLVEKRGIVGTVTDSSDTQITLNDLSGNTRFIDVDELTKFSSDNSKTYGISDVTKGTYLGILGLYNKDSRRILAREISVMQPFPKIIYGIISNIDTKNFELTITKQNEQKIVVEIEDITKSYLYSNGTTLKSGFSKMEVGQTIIAIGTADKQDSSKILGSRIVIFPDISLGSLVNLKPNTNPTIPPSTGSGVKLYPQSK